MNTQKNLTANLVSDLFDLVGTLVSGQLSRAFVALLMLCISSAAFALPANFIQETVIPVGNLSKPTSVVTLPNDNMFIAEQAGAVKMFDPSTIPATTTTILTIPNVNSGFERGVATLVLDPSFGTNGFFYIYYTNDVASANRVSRFTFSGGTADPSSEVLVWQDNEPWQSCCHFGGGMDFGPDGHLYITTGEEFDVTSTPAQAQDLGRAGGKIIRVKVTDVTPAAPWIPGGANTHIIPDDNPDFGTGSLGEIWAYGLRNPFRAHWDILGNRFYIGEVGGNQQATAREDLHIGVAGANYGWPFCEGQCADPAYEDPIYDYGHTGATPNGGAIAAGVVYRGNNYPSSYQDTFFFSDYVEGYVKYLIFNPDGSFSSVNDFATGAGSPVAMELGPDGALYVIDYGGTNTGAGRLIRYVYSDGNLPPNITSATGTPTVGPTTLNVTFTAVADDPDGPTGSLTYLWSFGDGTPDEAGASVVHAYPNAGNYAAFVRVSDATLTTVSDPIQIQAGVPPVVSIDAPLPDSTFRAGDTINYAGTATSGTPPYNYQWNIDFFHNAHIHPGPNSTMSSDSFQIGTSGHDYFDSTGYTLKLTVTDDEGLTTTEEISIFPEKRDMNLSTVPAGLNIFVDGLSFSTIDAGGLDYDTVINFEHLISVPETVCDAGSEYNFSNWTGQSAGQPRVHTLTVPAINFGLTANYSPTGAGCSAVPVQAGLVAYYEADVGVTSTGNVVTGWADQSGAGNDLTGLGNPILINNALNGNPVIDFDGTDDELQRLSPASLPTGADDRTMFLVANYRLNGAYGGAAYGDAAINQAFGLVTDAAGKLTVQGYGATNDYIIGDNVDDNWLVQSAVLDDTGVLQHLRDGGVIDTQMHNYQTGSSILTLGAELSGVPATMSMQIAAVVIYDRALSVLEQADVYAYLQTKYLAPPMDEPPVANDDFTSVASSGSVNVNVLVNDTDANDDIDIASVMVVANGTSGTATANPDGSVTYQHGGSGTSDTFTYTVNDLLGATSNAATVTVSTGGLVQAGLVAYYEADVGVVTGAGNVVTSWADQSGQGNDLSVGGDPTLIGGELNGNPVIDFDGVDDELVKLTPTGLSTGSDGRTMYLVANYRVGVGGYGGAAYGVAADNQTFGLVADPMGRLTVQGYGVVNDYIVAGDIRDNWLVQSVVVDATNGLVTHYRDGGAPIDTQTHMYTTGSSVLRLGAEISGVPDTMNMQIAALLIYDRPLSMVEQGSVQGYLQTKYFAGNQPPVAVNDTANAPITGVTRIVVLANDTDDGNLVPSSVAVVSQPTNGRALANPDGTITYLSSGVGGTDSFTYTVDDDLGDTSNPATVTLSLTPRGNLPPVAANDVATMVNGGMTTVAVLANDTDTDGALVPASVSIVVPASNGTAVANTDGTITYTHGGGAATSDSFTYTVNDNNASTSNIATVSMTMDGSAPVGINDNATVASAGTVVINVIANDTDAEDNIDGSTLTIMTPPSEGTLFDNNDGTVDYTHTGAGNSDTFEYTVMDTTSLTSNVTQVSITITSGGGARVTADQQVLYTFSEGSGSTVNDQSGLSPALNLSIQNPGAVTWGSGTLSVNSETSLQSGVATRLSNAVISTNEVTVEAWVTAANTTQSGPARIVSLSANTGQRNVTLGQVGDHPDARLRTTTAGSNGADPSLSGNAGSLSTNQAHVVYTRAADGTATLYVDNVVVGAATITGDLSTWSTAYSLILANEFVESREWLGEFDLVAIYSRALTSAEVAQNYAAGANGSGGAMNAPIAPVAPLASSDAASVATGGFVTTNVTSNDTDANGNLDAATVAITSPGSEGTTAANGDGSVTYVHTGGGTTDTYEYTVMDTTGLTSNAAVVTVNITGAAGVAPIASDDTGIVANGSSVNVNVVTNDTDANNDLNPATVSITSNGSEGTATSNGDGTITYVHTGGGAVDSFEYTVMDFASLTSNVATVTVSITQNGGGRVTADQQVLYTFDEGGGNMVADQSGLTPSLNLIIQNPGAVSWGGGTLNVNSSTSLQSDVATRLSDAVKASNEVTVEAWVKAANTTQTGPSRIVSLSESTTRRNVTLGQVTDRADARLRTTITGPNGASPSLGGSSGSLGTSLAHVVYTRANDGTATLYVNNVSVATAQIGGNLSTWSGAYKLILANEYGNDRTWLGEYDLIAIYSRALTSAEVGQNFSAGSQPQN